VKRQRLKLRAPLGDRGGRRSAARPPQPPSGAEQPPPGHGADRQSSPRPLRGGAGQRAVSANSVGGGSLHLSAPAAGAAAVQGRGAGDAADEEPGGKEERIPFNLKKNKKLNPSRPRSERGSARAAGLRGSQDLHGERRERSSGGPCRLPTAGQGTAFTGWRWDPRAYGQRLTLSANRKISRVVLQGRKYLP